MFEIKIERLSFKINSRFSFFNKTKTNVFIKYANVSYNII